RASPLEPATLGPSLVVDMAFLFVQRGQRESVGVIHFALPVAEREEEDRPEDQAETDEQLEENRFHQAVYRRALGGCSECESEMTTARTVDSELTGMSTAHRSGVMKPA